MELEFEVGPSMPAEIRHLLVEILGARDGDTVAIDPDGAVGLGRYAGSDGSRVIASHLLRLRPSSAWPPASPSQPHSAARPGRSRDHLNVVR